MPADDQVLEILREMRGDFGLVTTELSVARVTTGWSRVSESASGGSTCSRTTAADAHAPGAIVQ
jgi:hypothetical protein